ncbi:MAG: BadF/BadG/BcrA/BcrD ATPase family protein [Bacilli bacterium]|jgi:N-acetylglucosamine kinase-like BadF-type ATPase|nr:BadF/BadG/BcrA/BcrD ATPase family protein [Bacilli bacterium]
MNYILGVDGGNTKTDYFLFDTDANLIDYYRGGTCSHEGLKDGFEGSYRVLKAVLDDFLGRNQVEYRAVSASAFGLAGVDTPYQKKRLEEVIKRLGFSNFRVVNDSFLGIKAGSPFGYGVCSINGTGTSSGGIDEKGDVLQVGGIGAIVGDEAGGYHISRQVVRAVYDEAYRFGEKTSLTPIVYSFLGVQEKAQLMEKISDSYLARKVDYTTLTIACFEEANKKDPVAIQILQKTAHNLARSAGGVVVNMNFREPVPVILAGSVWVKGSCPILVEEFKKAIELYTKKKCDVSVLMVPPATGAVIWALEQYQHTFPSLDIRQKIIKQVEKRLADS